MVDNNKLIKEMAKQVINELKSDKETYRLVHDYLLSLKRKNSSSLNEGNYWQNKQDFLIGMWEQKDFASTPFKNIVFCG